MWSLRPCRVKTLERLGIPEKPSPPLKSSSLHDFYHVTFPVKAGARKTLPSVSTLHPLPTFAGKKRQSREEKGPAQDHTVVTSQTHQQTRTHKRFSPSSHLEGLHLKAGPTFSKGPGRGLLHFLTSHLPADFARGADLLPGVLPGS